MMEKENKIVEIEGKKYELIPLLDINGGIAFDADSYTLKPVENKVTLQDMRNEMGIPFVTYNGAHTEKMTDKLRAIRDILVVAEYLNKGWKPDFKDYIQYKYSIDIVHLNIKVYRWKESNISITYFKTKELAQQAIDILGEDTIRLAHS